MGAATDSKERIEILDALRGLALLGILLANILYWSGWVFMNPEQQQAFAGADVTAWRYRFHHLLIDGKSTRSSRFCSGPALPSRSGG